MKRFTLRHLLLMCSALLLTACFGPKTPQEVSEAFWESVVSNDADDAVEYSTLTDAAQYDGFDKDWDGFRPAWGKVVIDGDEASVETAFSKPGESGDREFVTYLVRRDDEWVVDYERTGEEVRGGVFAGLIRKLNRLGDNVSKQLKSSAEDFNAEMERMGDEFEELSDSFGKLASESIKKHGEELRHSLKDLEESVNRALKELGESLSDEDRRVLNEVAADLSENRQSLADPSPASIAGGSKSIGKAQLKLGALNEEVLGKYQERWRRLGEQFEDDMRNLIAEMSAAMSE